MTEAKNKLKVKPPLLKNKAEDLKPEIIDEANQDKSNAESDSDIEAEIEILKGASPEELYQLLASDPDFYLNLLENHKSPDEDLGQRFRCLISRNENDTLNIKFKIFPNDRWVEIGYFEDMSDQEVYEDFTSHVDALLKRSSAMIEKSHRPHLSSEMGEENDISSQNYQGKVNPKLPIPDQTILNREFGEQTSEQLAKIQAHYRQSIIEKKTSTASAPSAPPTNPSTKPRRVHHFTKGPLGHYAVSPSASSPTDFQQFPPKEVDESLSPPPLKKAPEICLDETQKTNLKDEVTAYEQQLLEQMTRQLSTILALGEESSTKHSDPTIRSLTNLMEICPNSERANFQRLIDHLANQQNQTFYREFERISQAAPSYYQPILKDFISRGWSRTTQSRVYLDPYVYNHREVLACLDLDEIDRRLIKEHRINLVRLWNQHLN